MRILRCEPNALNPRCDKIAHRVLCSLTMRREDRTELCERLILDKALFQRLFLHWNSGCRGFFIRLVSLSFYDWS